MCYCGSVLWKHCNVLAFLVLGLSCVAKFSADGRWYRAKVVDVAPSGLVTVVYVDYGNTESLPLSDIRKLLHRFIELPLQVVSRS